MPTEVTYLDHSGFLLRRNGRALLFDYYNNQPLGGGLQDGVLTQEAFSGLERTVFVSHRHEDHFNPCVFEYSKQGEKVSYVLSDDLPQKALQGENRFAISPGQTLSLPGRKVQALQSNDEGCAFWIEMEGLCIYYAGDLNEWWWDGEPDEENNALHERYRASLAQLAGRTADIAFLPVDPRLERTMLWGARMFLEQVDAAAIFPMHFWGDFSVFDALLGEPYADKIIKYSRRGETVILPF